MCNLCPNPFTCCCYHDKVTTGAYPDDITLYLTTARFGQQTAAAPLHGALPNASCKIACKGIYGPAALAC